MDEMPIMDPPRPSWRAIWFAAACVARNAPVKFVLMVEVSRSGGKLRNSWNWQIPALDTKMSKWPNALTASETSVAAVCGCEMSPSMARNLIICPGGCGSDVISDCSVEMRVGCWEEVAGYGS